MNVGAEQIERSLPPVKGERKVLVPDSGQSVAKIIDIIRLNHEEEASKFDNEEVCLPFWQGNVEDTAKLLFDFCKKHVYYVVEPEKDQTVKTPGRLLYDGHGDCKHYANFIVGICDALNRRGYPIEGMYRFVSDIPGTEVHHVFAVVKGKNKVFWVDPVISTFDKRPTFYNTKDYRMAISKLSGTSRGREVSQVAGLNDFRDQDHLKNFIDRHGINTDHYRNPAELQRAIMRKMHFIQMHNRHHGKHIMHGIADIESLHDVSGFAEIGKKKKKNNFLRKIAHGYEVNANNLKKGAIKTLKDIKTLSLKVSFAAARGPFLSLVDINAFNLAHRYRDTLVSSPQNRAKLLSSWKKAGGKEKAFINAVNNGWRQYIIHHRKGKPWNPTLDRVHGLDGWHENRCGLIGYIDNNPSSYINQDRVGIAPLIPALLALASGVIAYLNKDVHSKAPAHDEAIADLTKEGAADIAENVAKKTDAADVADGEKILTSHGGGVLAAKTSEDGEGNPQLVVDDYKHPGIAKAGTPGGASQEDLDGGGNTGQDVSKTDKSGGGADVTDGLMVQVNKAVDWAKNHKAILIGGAALVFVGPPIYKAVTKKKRR